MAITPEDLGLDNLADSIGRLQARKSKWQKALQKIAKGNGRALESDQRKLKAELRQKAMEEAESNPDSDFLILTPVLLGGIQPPLSW